MVGSGSTSRPLSPTDIVGFCEMFNPLILSLGSIVEAIHSSRWSVGVGYEGYVSPTHSSNWSVVSPPSGNLDMSSDPVTV